MPKPDSLDTHCERWEQARDAREPWDREARLDLRTEAGKTWKRDELDVFASQGRDPADYNLVAGTLRLVEGVEAQNRSDAKYFPRGPSDKDGAEAATKAGMMVRDQNHGDRQLSRVFRDAIRVGVGYLEVAGDPDPYSIGILQKRVNPFHIWPDPCGKEPDQSDWLDMFRSVVTYPHLLANRFPKYKAEIMAAAQYGGEPGQMSHSSDYTDRTDDYPDVHLFEDSLPGTVGYGTNEPRQVRAVERWYRQEEWVQVVRWRDGRCIEPNPANLPQLQFLARALVSGEARLIRSLVDRFRIGIFLPDGDGRCLLNDAPVNGDQRWFPFVPCWAYEDEQGRPMGLVRNLRYPQRSLNARMAHQLKRSLNGQIWFEMGAFPDEAEAVRELAKSNGVVRFNPGGLAKAVRQDQIQSAPIEQQIIQFDQQMIQEWSGVTAEMMGQQTNATSGTAIQSRQAQGQTRLYTLFDNRNWCQERAAEITLSLMRQTFTGEMAIRITETSRGVDFITLNEQMPDGSVRNDLSQALLDAKVALTSAKATEQLQALESWTNFASQLPPDLQIFVAPFLAKLSQIPDSQQFIDELEQLKEAAKARMIGPPPGMMPPGAPGPMAPGPGGPMPPEAAPPGMGGGDLPPGIDPEALMGVA